MGNNESGRGRSGTDESGIGIGVEAGAAVVEAACDVVSFVGDGGDDFGVGVGGVEEDKGFVRFVQVPFVDGFGETCKRSVLGERGGFADVNGGVFLLLRSFGDEYDSRKGVHFIERSDNGANAFLC